MSTTGRASLRELNISGNCISDDGMSLISSKLQYNLLKILRVYHCGLSVKGVDLYVVLWVTYYGFYTILL